MIEDTHVLPLNDWREHIENRVCWCNPSLVEDDAGIEAQLVAIEAAVAAIRGML